MMKLVALAIFGLVCGTPQAPGKFHTLTNDPCEKVYKSGFDSPKGCTQLSGGAGGEYLTPKACRDKCNANPRCKLWKSEKSNKSNTPWCWNYGNYGDNGGNGCHDARFKNTNTFKLLSDIYSGLSGCSTNNPCDKVNNSAFDIHTHCIQFSGAMGGSYLEPEACRAKCNANPRCKLWQTEKTNKRDTPWCWNFGDYGNKGVNSCHEARLITLEPNINIFSGLSGC